MEGIVDYSGCLANIRAKNNLVIIGIYLLYVTKKHLHLRLTEA